MQAVCATVWVQVYTHHSIKNASKGTTQQTTVEGSS